MTSRVAGRKEARAEEASCHIPTMTTFLWCWELRCWGPYLHGILRQPMGRADVRRATGTGTDRHRQCSLYGVHISLSSREEGVQGATKVVHAHTTYSRQVVLFCTIPRYGIGVHRT